jgi:hypothetical protein
MKFQAALVSACMLAPLTSAMAIPAEEEGLVKRNAWSIYFYATAKCNSNQSQGGFSSFGSQPCTNIQSNSADFDPQGCIAILYSDVNCQSAVGILESSDVCFGPEFSPVGYALQSFKVNC